MSKTKVKRQLMAEQWDQFARSVLPKDAPADMRRETRRAFYAGAEAILIRIIQTLTAEAEASEADVDLMEDVHNELQDFAKLVAEGRA